MKREEWTFVVDTDAYSGNFERELIGYMTGTLDQCRGHGHGEEESELFIKECGEEKHEEIENLLDYRLVQPDDIAENTHYTIYPTPGWYNDGHGNHFPLDPANPPKEKYECYQSVALFLLEPPNIDMMEFWFSRAKKFLTLPKDDLMDSWPTKIIGCRLVKKTIIEQEDEIWSQKGE